MQIYPGILEGDAYVNWITDPSWKLPGHIGWNVDQLNILLENHWRWWATWRVNPSRKLSRCLEGDVYHLNVLLKGPRHVVVYLNRRSFMEIAWAL